MKKLIPNFQTVDMNSLEDLLLVFAKSVENSLAQAGGQPGKDYTLLDCYKLAQPFVLELFKHEDNGITFSAGS